MSPLDKFSDKNALMVSSAGCAAWSAWMLGHPKSSLKLLYGDVASENKTSQSCFRFCGIAMGACAAHSMLMSRDSTMSSKSKRNHMAALGGAWVAGAALSAAGARDGTMPDKKVAYGNAALNAGVGALMLAKGLSKPRATPVK